MMVNYVVRSGGLTGEVQEASPKLAALAIIEKWQLEPTLGSLLIVVATGLDDVYFVTAVLLKEVREVNNVIPIPISSPKLKVYCADAMA